ncbi:MAG TPA: PqqD family peptide modification chaperone, partial [Kofleriaceae bacterium]|nr:PqqD family peptide modification chaperone [Kofleriaceae bacterium]
PLAPAGHGADRRREPASRPVMPEVSADSRPQLARKARLRTDRLTGETLLLYPEHGLVLNPSAAAILRLCDGRSAGDIAAELGAPLADVLEFLATLSERGLVTT